VVNLTAAGGAFAFGYLQDLIGHRGALALTLVGWILTILLAWAAQGPVPFWIIGRDAVPAIDAPESVAAAESGVVEVSTMSKRR